MTHPTQCSRCGRPVPAHARFCPECGTDVSSLSELPTEVASAASRGAGVGRVESSAPGEFIPGQVLSGRFRVIGLLGRGGMGQVYRADDLRLGQPVALKFLPPSLAHRADLLERLHGEVRNARQVSHPNVCRVYDVGEIDGRPFLTMEYVDGEDLGTLLRRIGRLPRAKADQVGRQMCAGLAAAHDRGVIHRDLKPSNVMLDGDGRVRITDFGLAERGAEHVAGEVAGTAAYMAPEQFDGRPATVQSDLYSLGLILYEVHTGKHALEANGFEHWRRTHRDVTPSSPSAVEPEVDEAVSRAILRCLEKDPARRPSSALQLAASLPGGDPLAAALAAGETPSPKMVATAGGEGTATPRLAWGLLAAVAVLIAMLIALAPFASDFGLAPATRSRPVLEARAREIRRELGYDTPVRDSYGWYFRDYERLKYVADHEVSTRWRREFRSRGVPWRFALRESPQWLVPLNAVGTPNAVNPPPFLVGMTQCELDMEGRLRLFLATPPEREPAADSVSAPQPAWGTLFAQAGLDTANFVRVRPQWVPPAAFDARAEWVRVGATERLDSLRVAAAGWRGRPVYFEVLGPWRRAEREGPGQAVVTRDISQWAFGFVMAGVIIAGCLLAWHNLRRGRGDRPGAIRLFAWILAVRCGAFLFGTHHVGDAGAESELLHKAAGQTLQLAAMLMVLYLAVEPIVRRHTPQLLIAWARLLEGRWNDPRVGRDVLIGVVAGLVGSLLLGFSNALPTWIPFAHQTTVPPTPPLLSGAGGYLAVLFEDLEAALQWGLLIFAAYFFLRLILRRTTLAAGALVALNTLLSLGAENPALEVPFAFGIATILAVSIVRFGLLTAVVMMFVALHVGPGPLSLDPGSPLFYQSTVMCALGLALAIAAFRLSLGNRPLFRFSIED